MEGRHDLKVRVWPDHEALCENLGLYPGVVPYCCRFLSRAVMYERFLEDYSVDGIMEDGWEEQRGRESRNLDMTVVQSKIMDVCIRLVAGIQRRL